jgi:hypothetical protein
MMSVAEKGIKLPVVQNNRLNKQIEAFENPSGLKGSKLRNLEHYRKIKESVANR